MSKLAASSPGLQTGAEPSPVRTRGTTRSIRNTKPALVQGANDADPELRDYVLRLLVGRDDVLRDDAALDDLNAEVEDLIMDSGEATVVCVGSMVFSHDVGPRAASEALKALGQVEHAPSRAVRRAILVRGLKSPVARVRDGAALGLVSLGDPAAIDDLRRAVGAEPLSTLQEDLRQALRELESAPACRS